ncbi:MAG: ADP-ribosylglycohydrolase family protein [Candidatus Sericytochromatia bacterium]|nr:ADP-ribosylglycohydrolase family protein [Candidatus Sericytochromatia bacterium]
MTRSVVAFVGSLVADALAMPVHWYYDREALRRDYGLVEGYQAPRNPHPGSILWRSRYEAPNEACDILREQAQWWGQRDIHYHQFLLAGENTLNFRLATALFQQVQEAGGYDPARWLDHYVTLMLQPGWHRDTYVEEYHRGFFQRYARGTPPLDCGISDEHIGGLAQVPALVAALTGEPHEQVRRVVQSHVALTHRHEGVLKAADTLVRLLLALEAGVPLREAIRTEAADWLSPTKAEKWQSQPDEVIVGQRYSTACYIAEAMPASLYLAWKYHDDVMAGIIANTMVGGDNCHRGAVVGSLLAAANGVPEPWRQGLQARMVPQATVGA